MQEVVFRDEESYNSIVDKICLGGKENIHILADFDKTLTKAFIKGEEFPSLIAILRKDISILGEEYAQKAHSLYNHYVKIEKDPKLSTQEKIPYMTQWWRKHLELLVESGLTREHIEMAVDSGYLEFREGIKSFIESLEEKEIPLVIISANGIGTDSIRMFFEKHNLMSNNIFIVSNELKFDDYGVTCGFKNRVIHSFNKSETVLEEFPEVYEKISNRNNVILLGDSLGDPEMVEGFDSKHVLNMGFYNNNPGETFDPESELFKKFAKLYDVVMYNDSSLEFVNSLLQKIK